ncbi:hypothetical protein FOWG_15064 [Fusarium oxysporum f. sp. lycopersici MN25]|nr:hypothetical protein FOWG_15064 [Fusarium oxysporum f. sp. lycopersici MN25]
MGFESFDDLVTSYYADEFEEASKLFHEQRFSRIRRLPGVFAEILEGARRWEPSERRGLGEEVLKEAEAVLMLENSEAWQSLQSITDAAMTKDNISTEQIYQNISTVLPMEMPNLWTLLMALVASDCPAWQRDCSGTALAITALLHFTGRIPKAKMLELIGLCIS